MNFQHTSEGKGRIADVVYEAIFHACHDKEQSLVVFNTGDILEALLLVAASTTATSDGVNTPAKRREFSKEVGKRFLQLVIQFQDHYDKNGAPFETVHVERAH